MSRDGEMERWRDEEKGIHHKDTKAQRGEVRQGSAMGARDGIGSSRDRHWPELRAISRRRMLLRWLALGTLHLVGLVVFPVILFGVFGVGGWWPMVYLLLAFVVLYPLHFEVLDRLKDHHVRAEQMMRQGRCQVCGYELGGLPAGAACPECGEQQPHAVHRNSQT